MPTFLEMCFLKQHFPVSDAAVISALILLRSQTRNTCLYWKQVCIGNTCVTYISAGIQLYKSPEGGQLKNQQPSKSPSSASAQKRAFSSCCGTKGMCGNASQRHSFISWLSKHPQRNIWILMCTLSLICLWNMNINLGKRGLISNRALTWNV